MPRGMVDRVCCGGRPGAWQGRVRHALHRLTASAPDECGLTACAAGDWHLQEHRCRGCAPAPPNWLRGATGREPCAPPVLVLTLMLTSILTLGLCLCLCRLPALVSAAIWICPLAVTKTARWPSQRVTRFPGRWAAGQLPPCRLFARPDDQWLRSVFTGDPDPARAGHGAGCQTSAC